MRIRFLGLQNYSLLVSTMLFRDYIDRFTRLASAVELPIEVGGVGFLDLSEDFRTLFCILRHLHEHLRLLLGR